VPLKKRNGEAVGQTECAQSDRGKKKTDQIEEKGEKYPVNWNSAEAKRHDYTRAGAQKETKENACGEKRAGDRSLSIVKEKRTPPGTTAPRPRVKKEAKHWKKSKQKRVWGGKGATSWHTVGNQPKPPAREKGKRICSSFEQKDLAEKMGLRIRMCPTEEREKSLVRRTKRKGRRTTKRAERCHLGNSRGAGKEKERIRYAA